MDEEDVVDGGKIPGPDDFAPSLLDQSAAFPPPEGESADAWLLRIPARWAAALLLDENGRPIQLICLKNLREGLRHRLEEIEPGQAATRKVKLRDLVRLVRWQEVDSDFEADWVYQQAAGQFYPDMYRELMRPNQAWFVHVDPDAAFPKYVKTTDIDLAAGHVFGPLADKHVAARLIELIEDAFDLCRYHHILTQYPHGKGCAYKEMGKCPAPCDGSISIEQYRRLVEESVRGLTDPVLLIAQHTQRMQAAAREMRFEIAGKIRVHIEQLGQLIDGPFKHARPVGEFGFVTLQRGRGAGQVKVFLVLPGGIDAVISVTDGTTLGEGSVAGEVLNAVWRAEERIPSGAAAEIVGLAARHLMAAKSAGGVFIPLARLDQAALIEGYRQLSRNKPSKADKRVSRRDGMTL